MTGRLPPEALERAAALLRAGDLVAFPTETVYGLGADARNGRAVAGIFAAKGRPRFNPLICHFPDAEAAFAEVVADERARSLAERFWPGPLTLVLPRRRGSKVDLLTTAGTETMAVRVPAHPLARELLRRAGTPVAAPSANPSGRVSPTTAEHVLQGLGGRIAAVLDGGACAVGLESTVLNLAGGQPSLLRPGGVTVEAIEDVIGAFHDPQLEEEVEEMLALLARQQGLPSPGMLRSHYAPGLPVRLEARHLDPHEALLAFGRPLPGARLAWNLSERGDLAEAASRLFAGLRFLDEEGSRLGLAGIAAMPVPAAGLGEAINDRLRRAAAPRQG